MAAVIAGLFVALPTGSATAKPLTGLPFCQDTGAWGSLHIQVCVSGSHVAVYGGDAVIGSESLDTLNLTVSGSGMAHNSGIWVCESQLPFKTLAQCSDFRDVGFHSDAKGNYSFQMNVGETVLVNGNTRIMHCDASTEPCGITVMLSGSGIGDSVPILWA